MSIVRAGRMGERSSLDEELWRLVSDSRVEFVGYQCELLLLSLVFETSDARV